MERPKMKQEDMFDLQRAEDDGMTCWPPLDTGIGSLEEEYRKLSPPYPISILDKPKVATGVIDYFPDAIEEVARVSEVGNEQHNPGQPMHWDREKSGDEANSLMRHFLRRGARDTDGQRHSAKVVWRALGLLQKEIEDERS